MREFEAYPSRWEAAGIMLARASCRKCIALCASLILATSHLGEKALKSRINSKLSIRYILDMIKFRKPAHELDRKQESSLASTSTTVTRMQRPMAQYCKKSGRV